MKTLSIQLPEAVDARLETAARRRLVDKLQLVRDAIEAYLAALPSPEPAPPAPVGSSSGPRPGSCLDLALDLAGSLDGPEDLSTGGAHLEGYGR